MSDIIKQVKDKQEEIRGLQKSQERKRGRRDQLVKQLKEEFEVDTVKEAKELLEGFREAKKQNEETLEKIDAELDEIVRSASGKSSVGAGSTN